MPNETNITEIVGSVDLNKIGSWFSFLSKTITEKIIEVLGDTGINVTERWVSLLLVFILLGIIFMAMKISKPAIKWGLIIIGIILAIGFFIPGW